MSPWTEQVGTQLEARSASNLPEWVQHLRTRGLESFRASGLPTQRQEAWKYTSLKALQQDLAGIGGSTTPGSIPGTGMDLETNVRVTFLEGAFASQQGQAPAGLEVSRLDEALARDDGPLQSLLARLPVSHPSDALSALNTADLSQGVCIRVAKGLDAGRVLLHWTRDSSGEPTLNNTRVCVVLEAGARLELVEHFDRPADQPAALNVVYQVELDEQASLSHARLQDDGPLASLLTRARISQAAGSNYTYTGLDLGGRLVRHDLQADLAGAGATCAMNGAYLPVGECHTDIHLAIDHSAPHCQSKQYFRGVLRDRSRAVWNGRVHVLPGADDTEAQQSNANLLLSDRAEVFTKPELEIEADELVASHGATVGQMDEGAVFYLRSRGISDEDARLMLIGAFCQAVVDILPAGDLRDTFSERLQTALERDS